MLLATSADRIFGVGGPGTLTAREAFAALGSELHRRPVQLTADGFQVRPEFVTDVWALARFERSVVPVGVVDGPMGEGELLEPGAAATRQLALFEQIGC